MVTTTIEVTSTTHAPSPQICGLDDALRPLLQEAAMSPAALETAMGQTNSSLATIVPTLPPDLLANGKIIQKAMHDLATEMAAVGWNLQSPQAAKVRSDIANGTGVLKGFNEAFQPFSQTRCK